MRHRLRSGFPARVAAGPLIGLIACAAMLATLVRTPGHSGESGVMRGGRPIPAQRDVASSSSDVIRIMTWNIRFNNPEDGVHAWPNRRDTLLAYVLSWKPDILCIQEGLKDQVEFLKEGLQGFDMRGVGRDDGKERGEYSSIYFRAARFVLLGYGTFWLSPTPTVPGKGWDAALPRIVTWVRLVDTSAARTVCVFNTHFDHQGMEARGKSAQLLRRRIAEVAYRSPVIVAGDFNAVETDPPYLIMTSADVPGPRLEDAQRVSLAPSRGPKGTFTGFQIKDQESGERIDYLFVSRPLQVLSYITCDARRREGFLSDHLPVVADIALFPRP
jgi:endonuclease/exonuclease/phosphatase family metal-dependent hydrolase